MKDGTGVGLTVMVTVAVLEQPPLDPVTVYVVVELGFALTVAPVDDVRPVVGDHE